MATIALSILSLIAAAVTAAVALTVKLDPKSTAMAAVSASMFIAMGFMVWLSRRK